MVLLDLINYYWDFTILIAFRVLLSLSKSNLFQSFNRHKRKVRKKSSINMQNTKMSMAMILSITTLIDPIC